MVRILVFALLSSIVSMPALADEQWQAGVARVAITPGEPMWMAGYAARTKPAEGTLTELYAKALALQAGGNRMVFVTTDLVGIPKTTAAKVSRQVEEKFQLPRKSLLLNASHTHCGPELRPERDYFYGMAETDAEKVFAYTEKLEAALVDLIGDALADLRPAKLTYAKSSAEFAKNRRFPTETGYVNQRYDDGPTDHDVPVLQVFSPQGERRAILFGYACHNTTTGVMQFNGDYAGFAQSDIEKDFPGVTALFMEGTGGDQNPYPRGTIELAQQHGRELADAVARAVHQAQQPLPPRIESAFTEVELKFAPLPARDLLETQAKSKNKYEQRKARYLLGKLDRHEDIPLTYPCPVQVIRFADVLVMVAIGGEVVVDYSRLVKSTFRSVPFVWVAGYSNDVFGYLPSARVLAEGGYEAGGAMLYGPLPGPFTDSVEDRVMAGIRRVGSEVGFSFPQPLEQQ